ncbi:MAG: hypothetical protein RMK84_11865 [Oscillochloridaceae bacterium]|nr:BNR repeat-containing protein [Chloroflexaceae bacterium]MDW8390813.1 hypothetical protein [Oscillochloridaceae bacterium]
MRRLTLILSALTLVALLLPAAPGLAQGGSGPRLLGQTTVPNVREIKFPDVVAARSEVFLSANANRADAFVWQKRDRTLDFPNPTRLGDAPGQADFSTTSIAIGPDGAVHYVWINQERRSIFYRRKPLNGDWGPQRTVYAGPSGAFPVNAVVEVSSDNYAYVAWREPDRPAFVVRSNNDGQNWSPRVSIGNDAAVNFPALAAGPNGAMAIAVTAGESDRLVIRAGTWNGSTFALTRVSGLDEGYADPTVTYDLDGRIYVAYRGIAEGGSGSGIFVSSSSDGNTWAVTRITGPAKTFGTANIFADSSGNLHLQWNAVVDIGQRVYYAVRPRGSTSFTNPIAAPNDAGVIFNSRMSANVSDASYAHVAGELFGGGPSVLRYLLFAAEPGADVGADPNIEDNAQYIPGRNTVRVSFLNIRGQPAQIRWRWNSPPTDTANDSNGWQPFSNPMTIPLPSSLFGQDCTPVKLYTQVREADGDTGAPQSDDIIIDPGIQAAVIISNPHIARRAPRFTPAGDDLHDPLLPADSGAAGASDGHPGYTREPGFYLDVRGVNDCSNLKDVAAGRSITSFARAIPMQNDFFANALGYPGRIALGENNLLVRVSDRAGNQRDYQQTLIYDPVKPVLASSTPDSLRITSNAQATILTTLSFSNFTVTDNAYPGRGFWGVWLANSRQPVNNPATDPSLVWTPVQAPGDGTTFTITNWSLASGLRADQLTPGAYYVYARFLDGAGNPTDGHLTATINLTSVTFTRTHLPVMRR